MKLKKNILVSPLNWGIGHATRCIPIIKKLQEHNFNVIIASSGRSLDLLIQEFPNLDFIKINDYNIKYYSSLPMTISMLIQIPKILFNIQKENNQLKAIINDFKIDGIKIKENLKITGPESVYNFLLAFGLAYYSELYDFEALKNNIKTLKNPPGRYQVLDINEKSIIVDYSHTPDAIEKVISYTRDLYQNEIIVVFGAGGNRDKSKRKLMGKASQLANKIIITNDNPRNENPMEIAKDILAGIDLQKDAKIILDRRDALEEAISFLNDKTTLLVLGKGHEKHQEIGDRILDFDDVVVIKDILGSK